MELWYGVLRLLIAFFEPTAEREDETVLVRIDGEQHALPSAVARRLHASLHDALTERRAFVHTAYIHHADGRYVVERRRGTSSGNRVVFDSLSAVRQCFDDLPETFGATDVDCSGVTGSRRHLLVRHFAESSDFACELVCENPLQAEKRT